MLRGLFSGGICGVLVGGAVLTVASLASDQPAGNTPPVPPQVNPPEAATDVQTSMPVIDAPTPAPETAPSGNITAPLAPVITDEAALPLADTASAAVPQTADVSGGLEAPDETSAPALAVVAEEPVLPNPQSIAPQVPVNEQDLTVSTAPAELPAPVVVETPVEDAADAPMVVAVPVIDIAVPQPTPAPTVVIDEPAPEPAPQEQISDLDGPTLIAPQTDTTASLPTGDSGVVVRRPTSEAPAAPAAAAQPTAGPALALHAAAFDNVDSRPLMSIVMLDDGSLQGAVAAVSSLPFAVTVVLDPTLDDAASRLAAYRAAGVEVGVRSALPAGATQADVEVALEASFGVLPETVLLLDAGDGGLQNNRAVTEQAMAGLATGGRGLVTVSKGLNMALRAAEQAEVPAGVIFRDLDADGQDARVIRRFLDQAAFGARQESGVFLLARVRPATISALVLWGTANRAGQVAVAPASAVLSAQTN